VKACICVASACENVHLCRFCMQKRASVSLLHAKACICVASACESVHLCRLCMRKRAFVSLLHVKTCIFVASACENVHLCRFCMRKRASVYGSFVCCLQFISVRMSDPCVAFLCLACATTNEPENRLPIRCLDLMWMLVGPRPLTHPHPCMAWAAAALPPLLPFASFPCLPRDR
jgi:hypothetical protein